MPKSPNFFVNLVTRITAIAISLNLFYVAPVLAITQTIDWETNAGYRIETTFSYQEIPDVEIIREKGKGKTKVLDFLKVSFYQPSGELIASYDNIVDGIARGNYFEFNYDRASQKPIDNLDLGGESAGEMYLKGQARDKFSLIEVKESGVEKEIDYLQFKGN